MKKTEKQYAGHNVYDKIFHDYDIRGVYGPLINEEFAEKLGHAIISLTKAKNVVIGYDSRTSNLALFSALAKGITSEGSNITHIGLVTRPMVNWIAWTEKFDLGITITASHNPKEYNGFKFIWKGRPLAYRNGLNRVKEMIDNTYRNSKRKGKIISKDYINEYVAFLSSKLKLNKKMNLKIVADASNGAAGEIIKRLMEENNIDCELLFAEPDGHFPCHNPNPLDNNALVVLSHAVVNKRADFGFIVDPDADRIRFVDEKGQIIDNSYIQCLVVKEIINKGVVHDVISRKILSEVIRRNKCKENISRVGFIHIIEKMMETKSVYGCEMSGHNYFRDMNNQDSGLMMLIHVINIYLKNNKRMSSLVKPFDKYIDLGELNYKVADKGKVIEDVKEYFRKNKKKLNVKKINLMDGVSVISRDYWLNIRPSNTEPLVRLRIEGKHRKTLMKAQKELEKIILKK